jgi:hypothetical protein
VNDNLIYASGVLRSSISSLRKKLSNIKVVVEQFDADLDKIDAKFEKFIVQTEIYKTRLEREIGREVRKLEHEIVQLKKRTPSLSEDETPDDKDSKIASTIAIFETIVRFMCEGSEDFRLVSYSFLFPAVFEKVVQGKEEAYFLDEVPSSAILVINRGKEYIEWIRSECGTHLVEPEAWDKYSELICEWWRNDALPLIYGSRDDQWDIEIPLSMAEMLMWRDEPSERPIHFPAVFDAYEVFKKLKDSIYTSSGVRDFELKMFSYTDNG